MSFLVIGFIPDAAPERDGVHTPLRQDGYYRTVDGAMGARGVAEYWRANKKHPRERVAIVEVVDEGAAIAENSDVTAS